jgi:hypothetical protein
MTMMIKDAVPVKASIITATTNMAVGALIPTVRHPEVVITIMITATSAIPTVITIIITATGAIITVTPLIITAPGTIGAVNPR